MKILMCNDDGYGAEGMEALASLLKKEHDVWIVAPDGNRSGSANAMNLNKELELKKIKDNEYTLSGTPTDCIMAALRGNFLPSRPDVIVSGINKGGNMGSDIVYSGTCGAARQAALYGIPAMALSVEWNNGSLDFIPFAKYAVAVFDKLYSLAKAPKAFEDGVTLRYFVNVNALSLEQYKGMKAASVSERIYGDKLVSRLTEDGRTMVSLVGGGNIISRGNADNDVRTIEDGYVACSLIDTLSSCIGFSL